MKSTRTGTSTRRTRRSVVRGLAGLGTAGLVGVAGCLGGASTPGASAAPTTDSPTATEVPTDASSAGTDAAPVDCSTVPSSLGPVDADAVEFTFAFDLPDGAGYTLEAGETAVQRVATSYFKRDGAASHMDWDFNVDVTESVDTYGDLSRMYPDASEVFSLDYAGTAVPVRHQAITDDQDVWVVALPADGEFRSVQVGSSVMPGEFGCHDVIRDIAERVTRSIRPR